MIEESEELLNSYLNKSSQIKIKEVFQSFLLGKIDGKVYFGFMANNYKGLKLSKCLNKMISAKK